ncbi:response regulator transcription factor [Butyrivibrio sp. MC2013]|uniref:response regulator transcription factor n=1 Tax=Butyrivibrio sp. MC2013 TaxID=1280686 RepID=UPI00040BC3AF|nr:response regulator [Butyrivibrio sp. MC2013]
MKTLLIVEDEKLIRHGISTMVKRSGVPVEMILECSNGEEALNIISSRSIDVVFTDIRMQKMDGIELARRASQLPHPPLMVAISGYDDFTYAVEMLRNGVRDYLLKPVDRDKITEVLMRLEEELSSREEAKEQEKELSLQQLRSLLAEGNMPEADKKLIIERYRDLFPDYDYMIACYPPMEDVEDGEEITIKDLPFGAIKILPSDRVGGYLRNELSDCCPGVSNEHHGLEELEEAYDEAVDARKYAFVLGKSVSSEKDHARAVPNQLKESARNLLTEDARTGRIQVMGTDKTEEVISRWRNLVKAAASMQLSVDELSLELRNTLSGIPHVYRENITPEDMKTLEGLMDPLSSPDIEDYESRLTDWVLDLNSRLLSRPDDNGIRQKIATAMQYIRENYQSDLNMAVVSNYVSMNYSLFSFSFKQYAGSNFVNFLKEIRINEAKKLLSDTDMKIVEISKCVGYDNDKHFMKTFKSVCGVSPGEYRKNMTR